LPQPVLDRLYPSGNLLIRIDESHSFLMTSKNNLMEGDLHRWGYGRGWEGTSLRAWARLAPHAATILDVGAYRGIYAIAARALNSQAVVIAFEPVEVSYRRIVENADINGFDIRVEQLAISDVTGSRTFYDSPAGNHAMSSLERRSGPAYEEMEVATTTLDDYLARNALQAVDLIKIDVEEHEVAVLRGMTDLLARFHPTLLLEVLTESTGVAVMELVGPFGYDAYQIIETDGIEPLVAFGATGHGSRNFLFCRPDVFETAGLSALLVGS